VKLFDTERKCRTCAKKERPDLTGLWWYCPVLDMAVSVRMAACSQWTMEVNGG
jgi:hypothetical protein